MKQYLTQFLPKGPSKNLKKFKILKVSEIEFGAWIKPTNTKAAETADLMRFYSLIRELSGPEGDVHPVCAR